MQFYATGCRLAVRPEACKGMGTTGPTDPFDGYWRDLVAAVAWTTRKFRGPNPLLIGADQGLLQWRTRSSARKTWHHATMGGFLLRFGPAAVGAFS